MNRQTNGRTNQINTPLNLLELELELLLSLIPCIVTETQSKKWIFFSFLLKHYGNPLPSRKHAYIIFDPLKPHFCIVKLGFTGVYIIFLISAQKHRLWVLVRTIRSMKKYQSFSFENFRRGGSNEYPQSMF